ncbi:unnamed protein product [Chrysoparadoxa australica]
MSSKMKYGTVKSSGNIGDIMAMEENQAKFNRSASVGPGMTASNLNPRERSRRALYVNLPFVSVYGMHFRESKMAKSFSRLSMKDMGAMEEESALLLESQIEEVVITTPLIAAVLAAVLLMFLMGFNTGVMNAMGEIVFPGHSVAQWSLAVSAFAIGGPFGAYLAGKVSNAKGRRAAINQNAWIFLIGGLMLSFAPSMNWLIPARVVIGVASGFSTVIVPIYLGELAPPTMRGTLGTLTQFSMVIGILASNLFSFPLAQPGPWRWRVLFGITPALALLQLSLSPFIFESPRWLLNRDAGSVEACMAIRKLRGLRTEEEVQVEIDHIVEAARAQRLNYNSAHAAGAVLDLLTEPKMTLLVVSFAVLHVAQQLSGINAVFYYSNSFFDGVIDNPLVGTTMVGVVNVLFTYFALKLMDRAGRVQLVLLSAGGMLACTVVITLALGGLVPNYAALVGVMGYVAFFELGLGPIPWLIVAEMFDAKYVATASSIASQINWASNFVVGLCFPFMNAALGMWSFVPFGMVLLFTVIFTLLYLPETAGRTAAEASR